MNDKEKITPKYFSSSMREQLKDALEVYRLKSGHKEKYYHQTINDELEKLGKKPALTYAKMRSLGAGRKSNLKTLQLLFEFICKVDKDFEFIKSNRDAHIKIATNLKQFSHGQRDVSDAKQNSAARKLDKKLFVSMPHDDRKDGTDLLISFVCFRWIEETEFLLAYKFSTFCSMRGASRHIHVADSTGFGMFHADIIDCSLDDSSDVSFMRDVEKGVVVPLGDHQGYFGILQNSAKFPRQVQFLAWEDKTDIANGFTLRAIGESERAALGLRFAACGGLHNLERLVFEMEEPNLLSDNEAL